MKSQRAKKLTLACLVAWAGPPALLAGCGEVAAEQEPAGTQDAQDALLIDPLAGGLGPKISKLRVAALSRHEALLTWDTEPPTTTVLDYDLGTWPRTVKDTTLSKSHAVLMPNLLSGEAHSYRITATALSRLHVVDQRRQFSTAAYERGALPAGWASRDIGAVGTAQPGAAWYDGAARGGTFIVRGTGTDVYNSSDSFHFVYAPISGDFELTLKIEGWGGYLHKWTKGMTMFRADLTPGSAMFNQSMNYSGLDYLYYRYPADVQHTDVVADQLNPGDGAPVWARLRRVGNTFTESYSADGVAWTVHGPAEGTTVPLPASGYVGFGACSKDDRYMSEIVYSNVSLRAL
jgi:hypothetical protein